MRYPILATALAFVEWHSAIAQENVLSFEDKAWQLQSRIAELHYSPKSLSNQTGKFVTDFMVRQLDPDGLYFTQNQVENLNDCYDKIDEQMIHRDLKFIAHAGKQYKSSIGKAIKILEKLAKSEFDFETPDSIYFPSPTDPVRYAKNASKLKSRWIKWIKYQVLRSYDNSLIVNKAQFTESAPELIADFCTKEIKVLSKIYEDSEQIRKTVEEVFLNGLAQYQDPHSTFYEADAKQGFLSSLAPQTYEYGIELIINENDEFEVSSILPGGPAWITNEIHTGDVLLQASSVNGQVDFSQTNKEGQNVLEFLKNNNAVKLTIQKPGGVVKQVLITKGIVRKTQNIIKHFVLEGERKIGYIALPAFYTNWKNFTRDGCANDVAKAIVKLKREKIEGLVLDLRSNGGGSVEEARDLAGIFIDVGVIAMERNNHGEVHSVKDANRGAIYNDPLIIMVNGSSASASEIVSGSLQNHNRALIVGQQTFGKSTGQMILPLDPKFNLNSLDLGVFRDEYGYVKLTATKYFRINSQTHQLTGVTPDISLQPIRANFNNFGEQSFSNPIANDTIDKTIAGLFKTPLPVETLRVKSEERLKLSTIARRATETNEQIRAYYNNPYLRIDFDGNLEQYGEIDAKWLELEKLESENKTSEYRCRNVEFDSELLDADSYDKRFRANSANKLEKDLELQETYHIMQDLINQLNEQ